MTTYLLAGGGTAGHVNPLLAVADTIREREPESTVLVLGTAEGLEARLVPERGYELLVIPRLPFPRRPNRDAAQFLGRFRGTIAQIVGIVRERSVDVVVGFGGYAAAPAYLAAHRLRTPLALHEANAKPGLANRLGSRYTQHVGVAFHGTSLPHAAFVGMPLRPEIAQLDRLAHRAEGLEFFGLVPDRPTLLVTGGSLGSRRINATVVGSARAVLDAGYQIVHITGQKSEVSDPGLEDYRMVEYCDRMDLALSVADVAVSRAGSATVSELSALGIPAVYVPYPVGNGEQRFNAQEIVEAGGGIVVDDKAFLPEWVRGTLVPLLTDRARITTMSAAAASVGVLDGAERMTDLVRNALRQSAQGQHTDRDT